MRLALPGQQLRFTSLHYTTQHSDNQATHSFAQISPCPPLLFLTSTNLPPFTSHISFLADPELSSSSSTSYLTPQNTFFLLLINQQSPNPQLNLLSLTIDISSSFHPSAHDLGFSSTTTTTFSPSNQIKIKKFLAPSLNSLTYTFFASLSRKQTTTTTIIISRYLK